MLLKDQEGMSLVEVMVALLILGVAVITLLSMFVSGDKLTATARHEVGALNVGQELMEEIKGAPYKRFGVARGSTASDKVTLATDTGGENLAGTTTFLISLTKGTGEGQVRKITAYSDFTKIATVSPAWQVRPDDTSHFLICENGTFGIGIARGGGAKTITLAASESSENDYYNGYYLELCGGTGSGQVRKVWDYDGSTSVATVDADWAAQPDSTSIYKLYRYRYSIEVTTNTDILKTVKMITYYQMDGTTKEVALTTEKLKR